jgi:predicted permease
MLRKLGAGLRGLFRRDAVDRELDDEMRDFLQRAIEERKRAGFSTEAAERLARAEIGSLAAAKDEVRAGLWESTVSALGRDVRYGARVLRRAPGFTTVAVLTLALGIGATASLFSLANEVLFKPLAVANPHELALFGWNASPKGTPPVSIAGMSQDAVTGRSWSTAFSMLAFERFAADTKTLSDVLAWGGAFSAPSAPGMNDADSGHMVSGNYFNLLGMRPHLGRLLTAGDDRADSPLVAVISHQYWQRRFDRSPNAIGRTIAFHSGTATIVGVTPPGFAGLSELNRPADFFIPLRAGAKIAGDKFVMRMTLPWVWPVRIFGRMKPGVSYGDVERELQGAFQGAALEAWNAQKGSSVPPDLPKLEVTSGSQGLGAVRHRVSQTVGVLSLIVAIVLLIVCVNVAGLVLARAETRRGEMALRLAIGAGRGRLLRQLLVENLILTGAGATAGILLASWGSNLFLALVVRADPGFVVEPQIDLRVLGATILVTLGAGVLIGVVPGLRATSVDPHPSLKDARSSGRPRVLVGRLLLVTQVAMSLVLVVVAGLFVRTLHNLETADVGFNPDRLLLFRAATPWPSPKDSVRAVARYTELHDRLSALPGIQAATLSYHSLLGGDLAMPYLTVPGQPKAADEDRTVYMQPVAPTFFETMGMPVLHGRTFSADDRQRFVVIVNETLARRFFGGADAVGRRIGITKDASAPDVEAAKLVEIVGVVRDAKYMMVREDTPLTVFQPIFQPMNTFGAVTFAVRTTGEPLAMAPAVRELAKQLSGPMAVGEFRTQAAQAAQTFAREREFAFLSSLFGALALALTSIGLYGLLSYTVTRRTQEIGVRMALGAGRARVVRSVLVETAWLVSAGLAAGLAAATALTRFLQSQLFGLGRNDALTIAAAIGVLVSVALVASALPARRASRIDPLVALRTE